MATIVVFGATGFTGVRVVDALRALGVADIILAGRDATKLQQQSERLGGLPVRVADARQDGSLDALLAGVHVVVDTVGPFTHYGEPVVRAALRQRCHFIDTTGEQAYMRRILTSYDAEARALGLAVINAQAFEFALGTSAASLLVQKNPWIESLEVFYQVENPETSRGTQRSALEIAGAPGVLHKDGELSAIGRWQWPRPPGPGCSPSSRAVPFPGGEALALPRQFPQLKDVATYLCAPRQLALPLSGLWSLGPALGWFLTTRWSRPLRQHIDRRPAGPEESGRHAFRVVAHGRGADGTSTLAVTGSDPYRTTGIIAALGAKLLCEAPPLTPGVVSTPEAFGAERFLGMLSPYGVQLELGRGQRLDDTQRAGSARPAAQSFQSTSEG